MMIKRLIENNEGLYWYTLSNVFSQIWRRYVYLVKMFKNNDDAFGVINWLLVLTENDGTMIT